MRVPPQSNPLTVNGEKRPISRRWLTQPDPGELVRFGSDDELQPRNGRWF